MSADESNPLDTSRATKTPVHVFNAMCQALAAFRGDWQDPLTQADVNVLVVDLDTHNLGRVEDLDEDLDTHPLRLRHKDVGPVTSRNIPILLPEISRRVPNAITPRSPHGQTVSRSPRRP